MAILSLKIVPLVFVPPFTPYRGVAVSRLEVNFSISVVEALLLLSDLAEQDWRSLMSGMDSCLSVLLVFRAKNMRKMFQPLLSDLFLRDLN